MALPQMLEGTWEEIKQHEAELSGQRLRVYINPDLILPAQNGVAPTQQKQTKQLKGRGMLAGKLSSEEYLRRKHEETIKEDEPIK